MPPTKKTKPKNALLDTWGRQNNRKKPDIKCENCGVMFQAANWTIRTCSRKCGYAIRVSNQPLKGKGHGFINSKGYKIINVDGKQVREHRHIMELKLGRKLKRGEVVHHINEIRHDNRDENLQLMTNAEHTKHHATGNKYNTGKKYNLTPEQRKNRSDKKKADWVKIKAAQSHTKQNR